MPYRFSILLSSLALAAVFAAIGWNLYWQIDEHMGVRLAGESEKLHSVISIHNELLAQRTQALAYSIAANTEIKRLLDEANRLERTEEEHSHGDSGEHRMSRLRQALKETMQRQWDELHTSHELQHLQFLLPDGTSFLRMEAPNIFGDRQTSVRPMLADVVHEQKPHGGFEIERTYAGVIGAVIVTRTPPGGSEHPVGIVEVGFNSSKILERLDKRLDIGVALLLENERISAVMQEGYRPTLQTRQQVILEASRPEAGEWLKSGLLLDGADLPPQNRLLQWKGRCFQLITFPLKDYKSLSDPQQKSPGTVLIWQDISKRIEQVNVEHSAAIANTLAVWVITQFFLLVLLSLLRNEWRRQLKQGTATIENLLQRNAVLLNTAANGICGVDNSGCITFINRSALAMLGCQPEDVTGKNPHEMFHHHSVDGRQNPAEACPFMQSVQDGKSRETEEWLFRRDGTCFPAKVSITPIFEQGQQDGAVIVLSDITEQRNRQEALLQLATTDSLTGVSNRRHFLDQLDAELSRQRRHGGQASLLMTDLDFFKHINDKYGHATGDAILSHYVYISRQTIRRSDIIGRLGGEEFAILLPGDGISGAYEFAERLRRAFEGNPAKICNVSISCTVSIGISELRSDDLTADASLRRSDEALYAAKAAGRNRTEIYDPSKHGNNPSLWPVSLANPQSAPSSEESENGQAETTENK